MPKFSSYIATTQRDEGTYLKAKRIAREEQEALDNRRQLPAGSTETGPTGKKNKQKAKAKAKGKAAAGE